MQASRRMRGGYANWTVTVTTEPVDDGVVEIDVPDDVMAMIEDCFDLAVNRYELGCDVDRLGHRLG